MFRACSGSYDIYGAATGAFQYLAGQTHGNWRSLALHSTENGVQHLEFDSSKSSSVYVNNGTLRPKSLSVLALLRL